MKVVREGQPEQMPSSLASQRISGLATNYQLQGCLEIIAIIMSMFHIHYGHQPSNERPVY